MCHGGLGRRRPPALTSSGFLALIRWAGNHDGADYKKTSLKRHLAIFNDFLFGLEESNRAIRERLRAGTALGISWPHCACGSSPRSSVRPPCMSANRARARCRQAKTR